MLDLEDAVPEAEKDAARAALPRAVPQAGRSGARVFEGRGEILLDGEFVDAPVVARYRAILERAGVTPAG